MEEHSIKKTKLDNATLKVLREPSLNFFIELDYCEQKDTPWRLEFSIMNESQKKAKNENFQYWYLLIVVSLQFFLKLPITVSRWFEKNRFDFLCHTHKLDVL